MDGLKWEEGLGKGGSSHKMCVMTYWNFRENSA